MSKQKVFRVSFLVCFITAAIFCGFNINSTQASDSINSNHKLVTTKVDTKDYVEGEVIVKYKNNRINLKTASGITAARGFNRSLAMQEQENFNETNISILKIPADQTVAEAIVKLEDNPNIEYAEPNYIRQFTSINTNDVYKDMLWGLDNTGQTIDGASSTPDADIDAPEAWVINEGTNASIIVAVIDTGVAYNHPDLINQMWDGTNCKDENGNALGGCNHGYDFVGDGTITRIGTSSVYITPGEDKTPLPTRMSHGTHVAGTIAAQKNNGVGIIGVAPNVKIMALKTDTIRGGLLSSDIISAVNFARVNGAKVINASFGGDEYSQAEFDVIKLFADAGGIFVAAAGNNGEDNDITPFYPAGYDVDNIIAVASTGQNDELSYFSQYGLTSVDVAAPGENILSAVADETYLSETFENVVPFNIPVGWVTSGTGASNWAASSTFTSFGISLFADKNNPYNNDADSAITLPTLDLSTATSAKTTFYSKCDTENDVNLANDYMVWEISKNGSDWFEVGRWNEASTTISVDMSDSDGTSVGYYFDEEIPSEYLTADFSIRFRWHTNESIVSVNGCNIDDVEIIGFTDGVNNAYNYYDGTSMATPHVAGLAGLIWGYDPYLSPASLKNRILTTGNSLAALATTTVSGKRINAYNALNFFDITPPAKPTITSVAGDNKINLSEKNTINVVGFAEANSLVEVILSDGNNEITAQQQLADGAEAYNISLDGTLATSSALVDGIINVSVTATDATGNVSSAATSTVIQDTVLPAKPTITSVAGDNKINNAEKNTIHVIGTAEVDSLVRVTLSDGVSTKIETQQLSSGGVAYDITINSASSTPSALLDGTINVSVTATDAVGNVSSSATSTVTQDTVLPVISSVATGDLNNNGRIDSVRITFNKNILDSTIGSTDFNVDDYSAEEFSSTTNSDVADNNIIYLTFTEAGTFDSGATPNSSYVQGTLADSYGNLLATSSITSIDNVVPIVTKLGDDSADVVLSPGGTDLFFSETLATSSRTTVQQALTNGADEALTYSWSTNTLTINALATTTFANDVMANVVDIVGNVNEGLLLVDSSLTATQISPDDSGVATSSSSTPQVVISDPNQAVAIIVSSGTINPTIDVSLFINSNGTGTLPAINITSANANNVTVAISSSTVVTSASTTWDGIIAAPTVVTDTFTLPVTSGQTKTLSTAIEIGSTGAKLSFDKAVKILLPGQVDKRAGYIRTGIAFTEITTTCGENSQAWADANLSADGDCKINSGSDLVIWTKHFTSFATYTQTTNSTRGNTGGGGGGGGGGGSATYCTAVTYSPWQACVGNLQSRTILTSTPASCSLTTPQQLAASRICELTTTTDAILEQATSTDLTISPVDSSSQTAKVMAEEKELTIKIDTKLIKRLAGRILLQTERFGQAWYLDVVSLSRYYLADGQSAYSALRKFGLGIKNSDLNKIPVASDSALPSNYSTSTMPVSSALVNRLKGRIVIQVENHGEAWYINPVDGKRYYLANGEAAYQIMRYLSLGISDINIRKISVGSWE